MCLGKLFVNLVKKYRSADDSAKEKYRLGLMLWAIIIGIVPVLLDVIVGTLMPTVDLPGSDYYFIIMALIPIGIGLAITQSGPAEPAMA